MKQLTLGSCMLLIIHLERTSNNLYERSIESIKKKVVLKVSNVVL